MFRSSRLLVGLIISSVLFLTSCALVPPKSSDVGHEIDLLLKDSLRANTRLAIKKQAITHKKIDDLLMPELSLPEARNSFLQGQEKKFDITVNSVPAKVFFTSLVKNTPYNITVSPQVTGNISLDLKNVTIEEVLETVRGIYGYEYQKGSTGYQILPHQLDTRIFSINYLDISRIGKSNTTVSSGEITRTINASQASSIGSAGTRAAREQAVIPISSIETSSRADFWQQIKETLTLIIGEQDGRSVVVNPQAGLVIVRSYPEELRKVAQYLDSIQNVAERQVVIEAKIIEVELNANYQTGINWNIFGLKQNDITQGDSLKAFTVDSPGMLNLTVTGNNAFNAVINLLNTQGRVHVLSSPRIATLNNQKAVIKVGQDQFFVTNVSSDIALGTSSQATATQNIELTPFFSGIALDVTPQINETGDVTLHIHPLISTVTEDLKNLTVAGQQQQLSLAKSTIRESDNIVRAQSGQVVVIGGLMENRNGQYQSALPRVNRIKGVGGLFKKMNNSASKLELVILLRPIVVSQHSWNSILKDSTKNIRNTPQEFGYDLTEYVDKSSKCYKNK